MKTALLLSAVASCLAFSTVLPAQAGSTTWAAIAAAPQPAAGYDNGAGDKVVITCDDQRGLHTYTLAISMPAQSLKDDDWAQVRVAGRSLDMTVDVDDAGMATLTASSSTARYSDAQAPAAGAEVYDAVAAMKGSSSIGISSGDVHLTVPGAGLDAALADAVATCGDPQKLAQQVKHRSDASS